MSSGMKVLVFNCGSSSIKYQLFQMPEEKLLAKGLVERIGEATSECRQKVGDSEIKIKEQVKDHQHGFVFIKQMLTDSSSGAIRSLDEIGACGHRVVHGGEVFSGSVKVDETLEKAIDEFADLAPLHNPPNLVGIREAKRLFGVNIPQIACFDTAFHQTIPEKAYLYALPYELYEKFKIRRYGFHGTSHRFVARRAAEILGKGKYDVNVITCHLGNGCSITAVKSGKSTDTSMGLTPLEGLVMGTRSGDFDPAIIFHLIRKGYKAEEIDKLCNKKSGLLGISGISNDCRDLVAKAMAGDKRAMLALEIFSYRVKKYIGAYLAVLNGCDAIVFTGGIGENSSIIRKMILSEMQVLGIVIDDKKNDAIISKEGEISAKDSKVKVLVIQTNEELAIARDTYKIAVGEKV